MGVFLSYVTTQGHALIDRDLYLPEDWLSDRERCSEAGIADTVPFRPKWELALEMLKRAREAGLPMHWVVADTVYGQAVDLRNWRCRNMATPLFLPSLVMSLSALQPLRVDACLRKPQWPMPPSYTSRIGSGSA